MIPFALLSAWSDSLHAEPTMPGLALLMESAPDPDEPEGEPHPLACTCPDCSDDSPILDS